MTNNHVHIIYTAYQSARASDLAGNVVPVQEQAEHEIQEIVRHCV